jgi:outer membrane protein assembly factor BamB
MKYLVLKNLTRFVIVILIASAVLFIILSIVQLISKRQSLQNPGDYYAYLSIKDVELDPDAIWIHPNSYPVVDIALYKDSIIQVDAKYNVSMIDKLGNVRWIVLSGKHYTANIICTSYGVLAYGRGIICISYDGRLIWEINDVSADDVCIFNNNIYALASNSILLLYGNGNYETLVSLPENVHFRRMIVRNDIVLCYSDSGLMLCYDMATRSEIWRSKIDIDKRNTILDCSDTNSYCVSSYEGKVFMITNTGQIRWSIETEKCISADMAIDKNNIILVSSDGEVIAVNISSGDIESECKLANEPIFTKPIQISPSQWLVGSSYLYEISNDFSDCKVLGFSGNINSIVTNIQWNYVNNQLFVVYSDGLIKCFQCRE